MGAECGFVLVARTRRVAKSRGVSGPNLIGQKGRAAERVAAMRECLSDPVGAWAQGREPSMPAFSSWQCFAGSVANPMPCFATPPWNKVQPPLRFR